LLKPVICKDTTIFVEDVVVVVATVALSLYSTATVIGTAVGLVTARDFMVGCIVGFVVGTKLAAASAAVTA
jgi:hypothetical protein